MRCRSSSVCRTFPRLPILHDTSGEAIDQPVASFCGLEQDRAAVRTRVRLIKRRDQRGVEEVVSVFNATPPWSQKVCVATAFYDAEAFVFLLKSALRE
jgi:hypothetical protein